MGSKHSAKVTGWDPSTNKVRLRPRHFSLGIHSHPGIHLEVAVGSIAVAEEEQPVVPDAVVGSSAGKAEP